MRRLSLCRGDGQFVQCGGNKVSNCHGFGLNMSELICGSQYSLGVLFEVLLNLEGERIEQSGAIKTMEVSDLD